MGVFTTTVGKQVYFKMQNEDYFLTNFRIFSAKLEKYPSFLKQQPFIKLLGTV